MWAAYRRTRTARKVQALRDAPAQVRRLTEADVARARLTPADWEQVRP
jgi:hypothetical protein